MIQLKELNNLSLLNSVPVSSIKSSTVSKGLFRLSQNTQSQFTFPEVLMSPPSIQPNCGASNHQKSDKAIYSHKVISSVPSTKTHFSQTIRSWYHQDARVESLLLHPPVTTTSTKKFSNSNSMASELNIP